MFDAPQNSKNYIESINSYQKFVNQFSPDDYFNIREHVENHEYFGTTNYKLPSL